MLSPENMINLIEKIQSIQNKLPSYQIDQQALAIVAELKDKFKSLCNQYEVNKLKVFLTK